MEELLSREECLQICNQEQHTGVVQRWQFIVQLRIEDLIGSLGFLQLLPATGYLEKLVEILKDVNSDMKTNQCCIIYSLCGEVIKKILFPCAGVVH